MHQHIKGLVPEEDLRVPFGQPEQGPSPGHGFEELQNVTLGRQTHVRTDNIMSLDYTSDSKYLQTIWVKWIENGRVGFNICIARLRREYCWLT